VDALTHAMLIAATQWVGGCRRWSRCVVRPARTTASERLRNRRTRLSEGGGDPEDTAYPYTVLGIW